MSITSWKKLSLLVLIISFGQGCISTSKVSSDSEKELRNSIEITDGIEIENQMSHNFDVDENTQDTEEIAQDLFEQENNDILEYQPKKGQTLMLIAFEIYGDYRKWKDLYELNKESLDENFDLSQRPLLKYRRPASPYHAPEGNPYLVKTGDSLSKISKKVYGSWKQWPSIYQNNKRQIRFPNLIFAGFTLYYLPYAQNDSELP